MIHHICWQTGERKWLRSSYAYKHTSCTVTKQRNTAINTPVSDALLQTRHSWVQNTEARLLLGLSQRDHVCLALMELHWMSVVHRIQFYSSWHWWCSQSTHAAVQTTSPILCRRATVICRGLVSARQWLCCSTDKNEIWRQSLHSGRHSCKEQSTSSSSWSWQLVFV